jgi:ATP-dependent helicase/nuclease subunit A
VGEAWSFRNQTLESLAQCGFAATLRGWIDSAALEGEPFLQERAAAFLLAAEEFDSRRKASDGIHDFLRFVESRQTQETEATGVVRVMTIHQSKGLGFDMVIASGLDRAGRSNEATSLALGPSSKDVQWALLLPAKEIAEQDKVLHQQLDIQAADRKYGELCTAYVALTRAKKALYVITTKLGEKTSSKNFARHLALRFPDSNARFGSPDWFTNHALIPKPTAPEAAPKVFHAPLQGTPKPISPSAFKSPNASGPGASTTFTRAAELGTAVHQALAAIEWTDTPPPDLSACSIDAAKLVREFLTKPLAAQVFTRPATHFELWREQPFDVMLEGQWVSGIFDRVVIHKNAEGSSVSAIIYDFKTDHGTDSEIEDRYRNQMEAYRQAAAILLNLPPARLTTQLIRIR